MITSMGVGRTLVHAATLISLWSQSHCAPHPVRTTTEGGLRSGFIALIMAFHRLISPGRAARVRVASPRSSPSAETAASFFSSRRMQCVFRTVPSVDARVCPSTVTDSQPAYRYRCGISTQRRLSPATHRIPDSWLGSRIAEWRDWNVLCTRATTTKRLLRFDLLRLRDARNTLAGFECDLPSQRMEGGVDNW